MTGHVPFDANSDWTNPYCGNSSNDPLVDKMLGNAYHVVRSVYCNLGNLKLLYDYLTSHGIVVGVQSEAELRALPKGFTKFARIYSVNGTTGDQEVTDYLYIDDDATGIKPDDPTLTGSWIEVIVPATGGGSGGSSDGGYIPIAYNRGSANGGETLIQAPDYAVGVPFIIVDGSVQFVGYGFTYTPENSVITLAEPLEQGNEVILMCTGTPANPATPNVNDWVMVNWLYHNGAAVGGESAITIPFTFQTVPAIWKNGLRYYKDLATQSYTVDVDTSTITLTEPLAANDRLIVQLGGEATVIDFSGPTGAGMIGTKSGHNVQEELDANTGSFQDGVKLFDKNDRILDRSTTPAQLYYWDGTFPKEVALGSTPASSGGIGVGKWLSVGDVTLRSDLVKPDGASQVGFLSRTVANELNDRVAISRFGADVSGDNPSDQAFIDGFAYCVAHGLTLDIIGKIRITSTVKQPPNSSVDCRNGVVFCEDPAGLDNGLMWSVDDPGIVNEKTTRIGTLILSTSPVIGDGLIVDRDVMGLLITTPKVIVENVYTYGCRLGGVKTGPKGYEITLKTVTCWCTSWTDKSKWGIDLAAADGINGTLVCVGYPRGIRSSGTNHIDFIHPWGFPATSTPGEYQNRQLLTALSMASNSHVTHCCLDSVDTDGYNTAQSGDDGVNIVFEGFNSTIGKCFILMHAQTKPGKVKIASYKGTQNTIDNLMVNSDTQLDTTNPVIYSTAIKKWQNHVLGGNVLYLTNRFIFSAQSLINGGVFTGDIEFRRQGTNIVVVGNVTCTDANITDAYFGIKMPDGLDLAASMGQIVTRSMLNSSAGNQTLINYEQGKIYPLRQSEAAGSYVYFAKADVRAGSLTFTMQALNATAAY